MKSLSVYLVLMTGIITVARAQNIYSGGRADGFAFQQLGFSIYAGGSSDGFAFSSAGTPDQGVPLPITLLSFTAHRQEKQVLLSWQTSMENDNDHFEVERSADGGRFQWLTSVASNQGTGNTQQYYQAIDPSPFPAFNYYRLKQVDKDGKAWYSKVLIVDMSNNTLASAITVYPNPAGETISMDITSSRSVSTIILLYNTAGTLVASRYCMLVPGLNHLTWALSRFPAGLYHCKVGNTGWPTIPFIKK